MELRYHADRRPALTGVTVRNGADEGVVLSLLGAFSLAHAGRPVDVPLSAQRLLTFLALSSRPALRPHVAGVLWPETVDRRACANLRSVLWRLQALSDTVVEVRGPYLALADGVLCDVREMCSRARALVEGDADPGEVPVEVSLFTADLLPDWYDEWILLERERVRQVRLRALEQLCEGRAAAGCYAGAIEAGMAAVSADPLRESAHRAVIRTHLSEGNVGEALRQYELCRTLLSAIGVRPTRQTDALMGPLLAQAVPA